MSLFRCPAPRDSTCFSPRFLNFRNKKLRNQGNSAFEQSRILEFDGNHLLIERPLQTSTHRKLPPRICDLKSSFFNRRIFVFLLKNHRRTFIFD